MKIALIGENTNDTDFIQNLLEKRYFPSEYEYFEMLDKVNGSQLDSQKTKRSLRIEFEDKKPNLVIFIRDLDSILPNKKKVEERKAYFSESISVVDKKGIYLLHIYEIEALILADIETFNAIYKCEIPFIEDPMKVEEPKEFLRLNAKEYKESDNPDVFQKLDFEKTLTCEYFKVFIAKFEKIIKEINA